jgi:nitroreductase
MKSKEIKEARTIYNVHDLIRNRWSARSFSKKEISQDELNTMLEAASWAFSAMNYQPWIYYYVHKSDEENFNKIADCLLPGNKPWAKEAQAFIVSVAKKKYNDGSPNRTVMHDIGAANALLMLQATAMNIYGHPMGGFDLKKCSEILNLDNNEFEPVVIFALGYLDEPEKLGEPYKTRELTERKRKPISDFAFPVK